VGDPVGTELLAELTGVGDAAGLLAEPVDAPPV
jgi:hypothetical protein